MAKIDIYPAEIYDGYNLENFEPIIRRIPDPEMSKDIDDILPQSGSVIRVSTLKREIGSHDEKRFRGIINPTLVNIDNELRPLITIPGLIGVSIVPPSTNQHIFGHHFRYKGEKVSSEGAQIYNYEIEKYRKSINRKHSEMSGQLGELGIFGTAGTGPGPRYVGPTIVGEGYEKLLDEHNGLLDLIIPSELDYVRESIKEYSPHLCFAKAENLASAKAALSAFQSVGLAGKWVHLEDAIALPTIVK